MKILVLAAAILLISTMALAGHPTAKTDTIAVLSTGATTTLVASFAWDYNLNGTDTLTFPTAVAHWMVINRSTAAGDTVMISDAQAPYKPIYTFRIMGGSSVVGEGQFTQLKGEPGYFKRLVIKTTKSINIQIVGY